MSLHTATLHWAREGQTFTDLRYRRAHTWSFDGGAIVRASTSPSVQPPPLADPTAVDPEEAFIAAVASCHMLWFLAVAAKRGLVVDDYVDQAEGRLAPDAEGKLAITEIVLRPRVTWSPESRGAGETSLDGLHHEAHESCFLARSVRCPITLETRSL